MKQTFKVLFLLVSLVFISGCEEDKQPEEIIKKLPYPTDTEIPTTGEFSSVQMMEESMEYMYRYYHGCYGGSSTFYHEPGFYLKADDLSSMSRDASYVSIDRLVGSVPQFVSTAVELHYELVTICNNLIARTDVSQSLPEEDRMHVIGNAKFIRALVYFDLCLLGDNVLLWTNIDEVAKIARHEAILQQVIEDLEFANEWVINKERDNSSGVFFKSINKLASKTAAKAYLAKAYMALSGWPVNDNSNDNWNKVKEYTKAIINEGVYSLLDDYAQNFGHVGQTYSGVGQQAWEGNKEAIWSRICYESEYSSRSYDVWFNQNYAPEGRFNGLPWNDWGHFMMEWNFYEKMRKDYRSQYSVTENEEYSYLYFKKYPYAEKFKHPMIMKFLWGGVSYSEHIIYTDYYNDGSSEAYDAFSGFEDKLYQTNDLPVIRFAEVVLMYAEACARTGETGEAIEKLNWIRRRAYAGGTPCVKGAIDAAIEKGDLSSEYWKAPEPSVDYPQSGESDLIKAIIDERAWEFVGELGGVRWFDLTRLEMVEEALSSRDERESSLIGDPSDKSLWHYDFNLKN